MACKMIFMRDKIIEIKGLEVFPSTVKYLYIKFPLDFATMHVNSEKSLSRANNFLSAKGLGGGRTSTAKIG